MHSGNAEHVTSNPEVVQDPAIEEKIIGTSPETAVVIDDFDDNKTPPVFGRLWRECVSVFTLAFAPGLNVYLIQFDSSDGRP